MQQICFTLARAQLNSFKRRYYFYIPVKVFPMLGTPQKQLDQENFFVDDRIPLLWVRPQCGQMPTDAFDLNGNLCMH